MKNWIAIVAILMAIGIGLGAFGAHALKARLSAEYLLIYEKAVFYHFIHALAILLVVSLQANQLIDFTSANITCLIFLSAIIIFSGSLYALVITGMTWLGAITPIGGTAFILGWLYLGWRSLKSYL